MSRIIANIRATNVLPTPVGRDARGDSRGLVGVESWRRGEKWRLVFTIEES